MCLGVELGGGTGWQQVSLPLLTQARGLGECPCQSVLGEAIHLLILVNLTVGAHVFARVG